MSDFFAMGGYASYVWSAYALTALVIVGVAAASVREHLRLKAAVSDLEAERAALTGAERDG